MIHHTYILFLLKEIMKCWRFVVLCTPWLMWYWASTSCWVTVSHGCQVHVPFCHMMVRFLPAWMSHHYFMWPLSHIRCHIHLVHWLLCFAQNLTIIPMATASAILSERQGVFMQMDVCLNGKVYRGLLIGARSCVNMRVNLKEGEEKYTSLGGYSFFSEIFSCWSSKLKPESLSNSQTVQSLFWQQWLPHTFLQ